MSVRLNISFPRGRETSDVVQFDGNFACNGKKVGWRTGYVRATSAEVFFWTTTREVFEYRFLAVVHGDSVKDCIAKFKQRYCGKGKKGRVAQLIRNAERP